MHQARMTSSSAQNLLDPVLLAEGALSHEFDLDAIFLGDLLGIGADLIAQFLGPLREVKDPYTLITQKSAHAIGMADMRNGTGDYDPVQAGEDTTNLVSMALGQQFHKGCHLRSMVASSCQIAGMV